MKRGSTERETCDLNGWTVGTRLAGDEGAGETVIEITAIGERTILAKTISHEGAPRAMTYGREHVWTLEAREWAAQLEEA